MAFITVHIHRQAVVVQVREIRLTERPMFRAQTHSTKRLIDRTPTHSTKRPTDRTPTHLTKIHTYKTQIRLTKRPTDRGRSSIALKKSEFSLGVPADYFHAVFVDLIFLPLPIDHIFRVRFFLLGEMIIELTVQQCSSIRKFRL